MRLIYRIAAVIPFLALAAMAQDGEKQLKIMIDKLATEAKFLSVEAAAMGQPVKGAPYAAVEVNETTQMLVDGTRIHSENKTQVYRDGQGRMRRETPNEITISDPVAGVRYSLNPKTQTGAKMPMRIATFKAMPTEGMGELYVGPRMGVGVGAGAGVAAGSYRFETMTTNTNNNGDASTTSWVRVNDGPQVKLGTRQEDLGQQVMEGVNAKGSRTTHTLPAGAIGNDRAIDTVTERWYSPELQVPVMTKTTDPRSGESLFHLTNVKLGEPDPSLFLPPTGYQITEGGGKDFVYHLAPKE